MISKEQVKHVATLARLKIDDQEAEKYANELSKILGYIDQLNEVDSGGRQIDVQTSAQNGGWRADKAVPWDEAEKQVALQQAELLDDHLFKVPQIM